jgi:hypothetical protein
MLVSRVPTKQHCSGRVMIDTKKYCVFVTQFVNVKLIMPNFFVSSAFLHPMLQLNGQFA